MCYKVFDVLCFTKLLYQISFYLSKFSGYLFELAGIEDSVILYAIHAKFSVTRVFITISPGTTK